MIASAILAEALVSMGSNRLRSLLTMLGIIIGVASVIILLAIGQGARNEIKKSIASMGSNLFIILSGTTNGGGLRTSSGIAPTLTANDATAIAELSGIVGVAPVYPGVTQVVYGANNVNTSITGTTAEYLDVREWSLSAGENFTDQDVHFSERNALLGKTVVDQLFGDSDPIGKAIRMSNIPFRVIGVLKSKGQSLDGRDQDDIILVPLTTAQRKLFGNRFPGTVRFIMAKAFQQEQMPYLEKEITELLRDRHRLSSKEENDFTIHNLAAVADSAEQTGKTMAIFLGSIASISLLVGGIGIMNIMLVSVTERTREIGIRKAIGARERDIMLQFLVEAIIICSIGSIIGILSGIGGSIAARHAFAIPSEITLQSILLSFFVAAGVGIFFGFYPAWKAARLSPVEALRYQ